MEHVQAGQSSAVQQALGPIYTKSSVQTKQQGLEARQQGRRYALLR